MSGGSPPPMKMRYTPPQRTAGPEVGIALVPRAGRAVVPGYPPGTTHCCSHSRGSRHGRICSMGYPRQQVRNFEEVAPCKSSTRTVRAWMSTRRRSWGLLDHPRPRRGRLAARDAHLQPPDPRVAALAAWLLAAGCTHVALESTGEYWKPGCNIAGSALRGGAGQCPAPQGGVRAQDRG